MRAVTNQRAARNPVKHTPRKTAPARTAFLFSSDSGRNHYACACGGGCPRCQNKLPIQTKLAVSQPGDAYEREADRVAEQVMRMPASTIQRTCASCTAGGTTCPKCAAEEKSLVQRKTTPASSESGPSVSENVLNDLGPGQPLDAATRNFFEPRFGRDLGDVRVHTDEKAAESARDVNALAYTVANDIVFGRGQSAAGDTGKKLLAHELTHVVQQARTISRSFDASVAAPAAQLMRTISYDADCSDHQEEVEGNVSRAQASAARWARAAVTALARPEDVGSLLRRHFNIAATDSAAVTQIRSAFEAIVGHLKSDAFTYHCRPESDPDCALPDGPYAGFATAGGFNINFCDPYPYQNFFGHKDLIDTLLHEAAHAHNTAFDHDTYEWHSNYPGPNPLTNADSYASFARDAALGFGGLNLELSVGGLMAAEPQFYIAAGVSGDIGGPAFDVFNLRLGLRSAFMPGTERQPARWIATAADIGFRINPIRERVYVDVTTGAFYGLNFRDTHLMAGIANRVTAGYRGERVDLGLDISHFYDLIGDENLVIVGVRGALRFP